LALNDNDNRNSPVELKIFSGKRIKKLKSGGDHVLLLFGELYFHLIPISENNDLFVWGGNRFGQLGLNDNTERKNPESLKFFSKMKIKQIIAGCHHSIAIIGEIEI
jgi:alpha-tubulin suppressor-like RCC1 family protein